MTANPKGYANPQLLITPADLSREIAADSKLLLLDVRPAEAFAAGHLPGAVHFDLFGLSLVDTDPAPMKAFLWMIEHLMASRGVAADRHVVAYEDNAGTRAARAFWFLEYFGHPSVRVLDGGYQAWVGAGLTVTREAVTPKVTDWRGGRDEQKIASWREVQDRLDQPDAVLLDTRSDAEYCGTWQRAARAGAIPGAVHIEWTRNLDEHGAFKPAAELRTMYQDAGVTPDREVVAYCQGGYRAAHAYLALRLLGYPRVRNYVSSWKEWGDRLDLPIEHPTKP